MPKNVGSPYGDLLVALEALRATICENRGLSEEDRAWVRAEIGAAVDRQEQMRRVDIVRAAAASAARAMGLDDVTVDVTPERKRLT